jgi:hypothetical protein
METELLVQADRLVGGSDAVLVIDDTAIAKNDFLPPSPPAQKASARKDQAGTPTLAVTPLIVRFNAQDAREFSDPLVRDAIASVFIAADLPRRYVGGLGKLAHCHPAMLTVFLQALSDV